MSDYIWASRTAKSPRSRRLEQLCLQSLHTAIPLCTSLGGDDPRRCSGAEDALTEALRKAASGSLNW